MYIFRCNFRIAATDGIRTHVDDFLVNRLNHSAMEGLGNVHFENLYSFCLCSTSNPHQYYWPVYWPVAISPKLPALADVTEPRTSTPAVERVVLHWLGCLAILKLHMCQIQLKINKKLLTAEVRVYFSSIATYASTFYCYILHLFLSHLYFLGYCWKKFRILSIKLPKLA